MTCLVDGLHKNSINSKQTRIFKDHHSCALMASTRVSKLSIEEIKRLLREQSWSPPVYAWRVESDLDSVGEPALWVWAVYEAPEVDLEAARRAESRIRKTVADAGDDRWVFVRFWTRDEFEEDDTDNTDESVDSDLTTHGRGEDK